MSEIISSFIFLTMPIMTILIIWIIRVDIIQEVQRKILFDHYEQYHNLPSYDKMLWQLTKWNIDHWLNDTNKRK